MRLVRGGATTIVGIALALLGFFGAFGGVAEISNALLYQVYTTWVVVPDLVLAEAYALAFVSCLSAGIGAALIGLARPERAKEEETYLDPLAYPPFRRRWPRALLYAGVAVVLAAVPSLILLPIPHSVAFTVPVVTCSGSISNVTALTLPPYALFTYSWHSSNTSVVTFVRTPSGSSANNASSGGAGNFELSSAGWSAIQSNGSALEFYACDSASQIGSAAPTTVVVSGVYYSTLL